MGAFEYAIIKEKIDRLRTKKDVRSVFNPLKYDAYEGDFYSFKAATYLVKSFPDKIVVNKDDNSLLLGGLSELINEKVHTKDSITEFCDTTPTLTKYRLLRILENSPIPYQTAAHLLNSVKVVG